MGKDNTALKFGLVGLVAVVGGLAVGRFTAPSSAVVVPAKTDEIFMTINGTPITKTEFQHGLEIVSGKNTLAQMAQEELTLQFAKKQGVLPADSAVNAKYAEAARQPDFDAQIKRSQQTPDDVKRTIRLHLAEEAITTQNISVTDDDMRAFYKLNVDKKNPQSRYYRPQTVQIAAIITETQALARKAQEELAKNIPFAQVAGTYSRDASKSNGGLLPPMQRGRWDSTRLPGLEPLVFAMKMNEQRGPLQIAGKWWIIRCAGTASEATIPFEKVKDECRSGAALLKGRQQNGAKIDAEFAAFRHNADIKILAPQYSELLLNKQPVK